MTTFTYGFKLFSTFCILIPIVVGLSVYKTAGNATRQFLYFLLLGFCIDIISWQLQNQTFKSLRTNIAWGYSLAESLFFLWFVASTAVKSTVRKTGFFICFLMPVVWGLALIYGSPFDPVYQSLVAFIAGLGLLHHSEKGERARQEPVFWLTIAVFFYSFCTFFLFFFRQSSSAEFLWILHNSINIISYLLYAVAFRLVSTFRA